MTQKRGRFRGKVKLLKQQFMVNRNTLDFSKGYNFLTARQ